MSSLRASLSRRHWALLAPVMIVGLMLFFGLQGSSVQAESRYVLGTAQAEEALQFDPYNLEAYGAVDMATILDEPLPDEDEDQPAFPAFNHPLFEHDGPPDWRVWIPVRPPPASPIGRCP